VTDDLDLFEMANLYPRTTGLSMTLWISPKHDARVKVNTAHRPSMDKAG
jgi:hypothetical protein